MTSDYVSTSTGITCKTFHNRISKCYFYKERCTYNKTIRLLFNKILSIYATSDKSIIEIFSKEFSNKAYVGRNSVLSVDREMFKTLCLRCAINLDVLFSKYKPSKVLDKYNYKWKIKGSVHGVIKTQVDSYNISLSFEDKKIVEKEVDFFCLNNYIYNQAKGTSNGLIVMCVPQDIFYTVPYNKKDYTIQRGFTTFSKGNKLRRRGEHCANCVKDCKPGLYNGLERLSLTI